MSTHNVAATTSAVPLRSCMFGFVLRTRWAVATKCRATAPANAVCKQLANTIPIIYVYTRIIGKRPRARAPANLHGGPIKFVPTMYNVNSELTLDPCAVNLFACAGTRNMHHHNQSRGSASAGSCRQLSAVGSLPITGRLADGPSSHSAVRGTHGANRQHSSSH